MILIFFLNSELAPQYGYRMKGLSNPTKYLPQNHKFLWSTLILTEWNDLNQRDSIALLKKYLLYNIFLFFSVYQRWRKQPFMQRCARASDAYQRCATAIFSTTLPIWRAARDAAWQRAKHPPPPSALSRAGD